jgi:hypothetical protein
MVALPETQTPTVSAIWAGWEREADRTPRTYLGASVLGDPCELKLWREFRWAHPPESHEGRMLRLFETGNVEEDRLVADLRRAGMHVDAVDPETGRQYRITFAGGHGGGHTDGEVEGVPEAPKTRHLLECKTHNHKSFTALKRLGVAAHKPMHYAQMQAYMHHRGLTRALYLALNKNDSEIYSERVEYDLNYAIALMVKAERIVTSDRAPSCNCAGWLLKAGYGCAAVAGQPTLRSCRTCLFSTAHLDGEARWSCSHPNHKGDLTVEDQRAGCADHRYLPDLIAGTQVDFDEATGAVVYEMADGSQWVDGGPGA